MGVTAFLAEAWGTSLGVAFGVLATVMLSCTGLAGVFSLAGVLALCTITGVLAMLMLRVTGCWGVAALTGVL